jgi:hypothetical protein
LAHARDVISKSGYEGTNGAGIADLAQSLGSVPAHTPVLLILQRFEQPWGVFFGLELIDVWRSEQRQMRVLRGVV